MKHIAFSYFIISQYNHECRLAEKFDCVYWDMDKRSQDRQGTCSEVLIQT